MQSSHETALIAALQTLSIDDPGGLARALSVAGATADPIGLVLTRLGIISEETLCNLHAQISGLPVIDIADALVDEEVLMQLGLPYCRAAGLLPLLGTDAGDAVRLVAADPLEESLRAVIELKIGRPVTVKLAKRGALEMALDRLGKNIDKGSATAREAALDVADLDQLRDMASDAPVIRLVNRTILQAAEMGASDIHIEPFEREVRLRFRVDGALRAGEPVPRNLRAAVLSRLKILAHLDIAETRLPQDGRIRTVVSGRELDLRVATTPTLHGEGAVIRLLDRGALVLDFEGLGFDTRAKDEVMDLIDAPNGIVLVTGPTGSGKTTTLYAALSAINDTAAKIVTVEDPVEYQLPGITQIQVQPAIGLDFAHVLRSILRQNPDIVMIGEIRDRETADIAIRTALTGHLVLATLHTNSAAAAMTRLRDMGVPGYLIASVVRGAAAQRLVRKLCDCAVPDDRAAGLLGPELPAGVNHFRRAVGCALCGGSGFRGRTTLLEVMRSTRELRAQVLEGTDDGRLAESARHAGMRSLREHGIERAARGETSLDEVLRVVTEL